MPVTVIQVFKRLIRSTLFILFTVWILLTILFYFFQPGYIYLPSRNVEVTPAALSLPFEEVHFTASDGTRLHGWFIPQENAQATLLFLHGNAGNISHRLRSIALFRNLGLSIFIFDYRGYGMSEGSPTENGTYLDAEAAWQYLNRERSIPANHLIIFGRSLGGAIAAWLATQQPAAAVILESTFTSVEDMARHYYPYLPVRWLLRIKYPTIERMSGIKSPLLLIHSADDDIVPFTQGQALFNNARQPKTFLKIHGDHNYGFIENESLYLNGIKTFLSRYAELNTVQLK